MAFYCVTKSREPTTNESDVFSALVCTLFVSVDDKLLWILPYQRKTKGFSDFVLITFDYLMVRKQKNTRKGEYLARMILYMYYLQSII